MDYLELNAQFDLLLEQHDYESASVTLSRTWTDYNKMPDVRLAEFLKGAKEAKNCEVITRWTRPVLTLQASTDLPKWALENFIDRLGMARGFYEFIRFLPFTKEQKQQISTDLLYYANLLCKQSLDAETQERIRGALRHAEEFDPKAKSAAEKIAKRLGELVAIPKWEYLQVGCLFQDGEWQTQKVAGREIQSLDKLPLLSPYEHLGQLGALGWELATSQQSETKDGSFIMTLILKRPLILE